MKDSSQLIDLNGSLNFSAALKNNVSHAKKIPYKNTKNQLLRYEGRVAIVTGAGRGIGRSIAILYARRGAKVLVNDLGCSISGSGEDREVADSVVRKIQSFGGIAVANYNSVLDSKLIVKSALDAFGRVDIVVCNAGIYKPDAFENLELEDWQFDLDIHLHSTRRLIMECWPSFLKNEYGRVVIISASEVFKGIAYGVSYCSSKMALLGLCQSVALEGQNKNILCNGVAPIALTRMNKQRYNNLEEKVRYDMHPKKVSPLIAILTHEVCRENGGLYRGGMGQYFKLEHNNRECFDFDRAIPTPKGIFDFVNGKQINPLNYINSLTAGEVNLCGKVAIVTGADKGLGLLIARYFEKMGAMVIGHQESLPRKNSKSSEAKADRERKRKSTWNIAQMMNPNTILTTGENLLNINRPTGELIMVFGLNPKETVNKAIEKFGKIDILVNCPNVHIAPDYLDIESEHFIRMYRQLLESAYTMSYEVWPHFKNQKYGRIINIPSMGSIHQKVSGSKTFKMGLIGLSNALAAEGMNFDIKVNTLTGKYDPETTDNQITLSLSCLLAHSDTPWTGTAFEVNINQIYTMGYQKSQGINLKDKVSTFDYPEAIYRSWKELVTFKNDPMVTRTSSNSIVNTLINLPASALNEDYNPINLIKNAHNWATSIQQ